jgi:hypothetical protein
MWKEKAEGLILEESIFLFKGMIYLSIDLRKEFIKKYHEPPL